MGWDILWILVSVLVIDLIGVEWKLIQMWCYLCLKNDICVWKNVIRVFEKMLSVWLGACDVIRPTSTGRASEPPTTNDKGESVVARCTRFTVYSWITQLCLLSFFENPISFQFCASGNLHREAGYHLAALLYFEESALKESVRAMRNGHGLKQDTNNIIRKLTIAALYRGNRL